MSMCNTHNGVAFGRYGHGRLFGYRLIGHDQADGGAVDADKGLLAVAVDVNHRTELMRSDDHFRRADLHAMIGQAAAILAPDHDPFEHIVGAFGELLIIEFDLGGPNHHLARIPQG